MAAVVTPEGGSQLAENIIMRPITGGSASICALTGNKVYKSLIENKPISEAEDFDLLAFLYVHCADLAKVRRAALNPPLWQASVLEWGEDLPFAVLVGARAALDQSREMLAAVKFDIEPKPSASGAKEEPAPPN